MKIMVGPKLRPARLLLSVCARHKKEEVWPLRPMFAPEIGILVVVVAAPGAIGGDQGIVRDILCWRRTAALQTLPASGGGEC